jgi:hypothetical protein
MADQNSYELEQLANQPGTYFNPHTEVVVIVDDSTSIDQDIFDLDGLTAEWVRVSDEVPVDESALEDAIEGFQSAHNPTGETVSAATLGLDEDDDDPALDTLEPDEDPEDA